MARETLCGLLLEGQDQTCIQIKRRYYQQAVAINKVHIDTSSVTYHLTDFESPSPVCEYGVSFALKPGETGISFMGMEAGASYFGTYDKSRSDYGHPQYTHNANIIVVGADEKAKCILSSLDKGSYVFAFQFMDGTVEIYGMGNGLSTGDYSGDVQAGSGAIPIVLSSLETAPESLLPLVYRSSIPGNESADFDNLFANPTT